MQEQNELSQVLRRERSRTNMTVRDLAEATGISSSTISRLETGEIVAPKPQQLQQLARALGIDVEELYATAGYLMSTELPALKPYLRAKFGLSEKALGQVEGYV